MFKIPFHVVQTNLYSFRDFFLRLQHFFFPSLSYDVVDTDTPHTATECCNSTRGTRKTETFTTKLPLLPLSRLLSKSQKCSMPIPLNLIHKVNGCCWLEAENGATQRGGGACSCCIKVRMKEKWWIN